MKTEFASAVGAIAYALTTQYQILVYVVALQRRAHDPLAMHLRRANALIRHIQRYPQSVTYKAMECMRQLETGSGSGFSKEAEKGYAIRGANHCRLGKTADGNIVRHLFDSICRSQRRVTRSTFSSELYAAVDATDEMLSHALCLHEIAVGPRSCDETLRAAESGELCFKITVMIDAMSVWQAVSAIVVREPAETGLGIHIYIGYVKSWIEASCTD